jgi:hypothetical protein
VTVSWVATYFAIWSGTVYTAFVIDVFSRRIVGWQTATTMTIELPLDALEMAIWGGMLGGVDKIDGMSGRHSARCRGNAYLPCAHGKETDFFRSTLEKGRWVRAHRLGRPVVPLRQDRFATGRERM